MRSEPELEAALDTLIRGQYYAEEYELRWRLRAFADALEPPERSTLGRVVARRLAEEPSVLTVLLCQACPTPEAVPTLISLLDAQGEANMLTRALFDTLAQYREPDAFPSVQRFLDSEQEPEALQCLAQLDFTQALFYVIRSARRPHLRDACLQILHERRKHAGLPQLITDLRNAREHMQLPVAPRIRDVLHHKAGDYNPFSADDIAAIMKGLRAS
jgi:hypothetical protein